MKKTILGGLCMTALSIILYCGPVFAQSIPSIGNTITPSQISQPRTAAECIEPNGATVYVTKQFYFGDTYTTRDTVPRLNTPRDELILSDSEVFTYNPALFNFTSPIKWKSNGVPYTASTPNILALEGTFVVNSINPGQIVYHIHRTALGNGGSSNYSIGYVGWNNGPIYPAISTTLSNKTFINDSTHVKSGYECVNYNVHYCGDGVVDTQASIAALAGGVTNSIANEECDGSAGVPAGFTCNASCKLVPNGPHCLLQPNQTIYCGQDATLNFNSTNTVSISNLQNIGAGIIQPNQAGSFVVHPTQTTIYGFRANGAPGTTPAMCTATVTVNANPQPNCSLAPSQTIYAGQDATLNFNSTFTNAVTNLVNISGGIIQPNQAGYFVVHPTQTTTYSFTVSGTACTTPVTCSATVTVLQSPKPALWIDKKLISNVAYHSGDLVGWRIDFGNNGTGIAHNVVLTDYLPVSLSYVNSQLYGVTPPYTINVTNIGPNGGVIFSGFDLAPGQTGYFIITGRLLSYDLCNQTFNFAYIESTEVQPPLFDSDYFLCYAPTTNLSITKSINKQIFYPGEAINFTIAVTNNGPDVAQSVQIGDIWPMNPSCIVPGGGRTSNMPMTLTNGSSPYAWTLNNTLAVGQTIYLYLTGQVANNPACAGSYINTGTLTYVVNGLVRTGRDEKPFVVIVTPSVNVSFAKTITKVGSHVGDEVSFALNYINNGTTPLSSYTIVDYWPGTLTFLGASVTPASITPVPGGQIIHWTFNGPLAPGAGGTITLNGRIN